MIDRRRGFFEGMAYTINMRQERLAQASGIRAARAGSSWDAQTCEGLWRR